MVKHWQNIGRERLRSWDPWEIESVKRHNEPASDADATITRVREDKVVNGDFLRRQVVKEVDKPPNDQGLPHAYIADERDRLALPAHVHIVDPLGDLRELARDIFLEEGDRAGANIDFRGTKRIHREADLFIGVRHWGGRRDLAE